MDAPLPDNLCECWEKFLAQPHSSYEDIFEDGLLVPLQRKAELRLTFEWTLRSLPQPQTYCELGADKGPSVYAWCKHVPSLRRVIACEIRGTPYAEQFEKAFPHIQFLWLPHSSYAPATISQAQMWLAFRDNAHIDVMFFDGDKTRCDTDWIYWQGMLAPNAVVLVHDIVPAGKGGNSKQTALFERLKRQYRHHVRIVDFSDVDAVDSMPPSAYRNWLAFWGKTSAGVGFAQLGG